MNAIRRFLTVRNGIIIGFGLLMLSTAILGVLYFTAIQKYVQAPSPSANIQVVKDVTPLSVPSQITAGVPFSYKTSGTKLLPVGFDVRIQMRCVVGDSEAIVSIATFYSNNAVGKYSVSRVLAIPDDNARIQSSKDCYLQSVGTANFYQKDQTGALTLIPITTSNVSNHFSLTVPATPNATTQSATTSDGSASPTDPSDNDDAPVSLTPSAPASPSPAPSTTPAASSPGLVGGLLNALGGLL